MISPMAGSELKVTRWRRYGKDRLYVEDLNGAKVGWWDLATDEAHPEFPEHLGALTGAITAWRAENGLAPIVAALPELAESAPAPVRVPAPTAVPDVEPSASDSPEEPPTAAQVHAEPPVSEPVERPWLDLATNHPGSAAREQANAAKDAAPVKTVLARVLGVHTNERAWRIGAEGEERVAAQLVKVSKRDPRWRFLHAIPVGERGADIDHLVLGPGGVFTVNAKHHPRAKVWVGGNTFLVNGNRQPYVRNSRHEAKRAAGLLSEACGFLVHVEGLIVTVNAEDVVVKAQPDGVSVVPRKQVAKWLLRHGDIHPPDRLDAMFEAARRSTTWR